MLKYLKKNHEFILTTRYHTAKHITLLGAFTNLSLGLFKTIAGIFSHSHALIADGCHSFADLLSDIIVLFASKYGSQNADLSHPYGHQRIETVAMFFVSLFLVAAGAMIIGDGIDTLWRHTLHQPHPFACYVALFSVVLNELLFYATSAVGHKIESALLIAHAWHRRSDAASSLIVLLGIIGSLWGFSYLDSIAAMIIGGIIIQMGGQYGFDSLKELVDTAVDETTRTHIESIICSVPGVLKLHQLRTRSMGQDIYVDVHILVHPYISVSEGHFIAQKVHRKLQYEQPKIKDVTVHVDPEDDEIIPLNLELPYRQDLEFAFLIPLKLTHPTLSHWVFHYLDGTLTLDVFLTQSDPLCLKALQQWQKEQSYPLHLRTYQSLDKPI